MLYKDRWLFSRDVHVKAKKKKEKTQVKIREKSELLRDQDQD